MATMQQENATDDVEERLFRFSDLIDEPLVIQKTIDGLEDIPIVPLAKAVEPLSCFLPTVQRYAHTAKERCKKPPADGLTIDESASIMLYSMGWKPRNQCLSVALNRVLRSEDRNKLQPWSLYLKLFLTALSHLPSVHRYVFRGVKLDLHEQYLKYQTISWLGFSSCTLTVDVLRSEHLLGKTGAGNIFTIECFSGKNIQQHAYDSSQDEIVLLPGTQFKFIDCLNQDHGLHTIHLQEIQRPKLPPYQSNKRDVDSKRNVPKYETSLSILNKNTTENHDSEQTKSNNAKTPVVQKPQADKHDITETSQSKPTTNVNEVKSASGFTRKLSNTFNRLLSNDKTNKNETNQYQNPRLQQKIQQLKSYSEVDFVGLDITDEDLEIIIQQIIIRKQCKRLYLSSNKITSIGSQTLAETLKNNHTLKELYLYDNQIGDEGVYYLCQALSMNKNHLKELYLGKNGITDEGAKHLVELLKTNKILTHLWLRKNKLSQLGIELLINANINNISLEFSENNISNE